MLVYKDRCYCLVSKKEWNKTAKCICNNKKCDRHAANIPFSELPTDTCFDIADFSLKCGKYKGGNK